jgi:polyhydroxyalkanoate synthase subunit PhaC
LTDGLTLWGVRPARWNSDSTRMLAKMRSFYLRHMYMKNLLAMPGGIEPDGVPDRAVQGELPACFVSTVEDRLAPWKTTYKGAKHAEYESQA